MTNDEKNNEASTIPYALLRYTFVGYHACFDRTQECQCHATWSHQYATFAIEKNLTRGQVIERLASWYSNHPKGISYVLPTLIAEYRGYIQYNHDYFGDDVAFEESLLNKAEEYADDVDQIEDAARVRSVVLVVDALKKKYEDGKV